MDVADDIEKIGVEFRVGEILRQRQFGEQRTDDDRRQRRLDRERGPDPKQAQAEEGNQALAPEQARRHQEAAEGEEQCEDHRDADAKRALDLQRLAEPERHVQAVQADDRRRQHDPHVVESRRPIARNRQLISEAQHRCVGEDFHPGKIPRNS